MKKLVAVLLCLCLLFTGCHKGEKQGNAADDITAGITASPAPDTAKETVTNKLLTLNAEWSMVQTLDTLETDYEVPSYEAKVPSYTIAKDLSNIENIDQFSGFTKKQINMLVTNGFVVVPSGRTRVYYVYDDNEYKAVPNFVTSDSMLHLYHQFYDKSLMSIESNYLYEDLELLTKQMLANSILLWKELSDGELKTLQEQNIVYFLVARMLFTQSVDITQEVDQRLLDTAKQEYELCQAAAGYQKSPLFGTDYDYSQFTVRGHYTRSEELGRYFKTMMWFGTAPYAFVENGTLLYDNIYRALLVSFTAFADSGETCNAKLWADIYQPTTQYVGDSDDVNVFDMNGLRISVYGDSDDPDIFNDEAYQEKLALAVKALPEPQIAASFELLDSPTGKQFRFMGQRYTLDSEILQKLIDNRNRPIPSSLDVMGVLGSSAAEELLQGFYKPQEAWPAYTDKYNQLKDKAEALTQDYWKSNLYTGWLWALQSTTEEYGTNSGMPFFMTTKAWKYKSLNTALGSYTELKHDSVLYGKQAAAEGGGPMANAAEHYVEPDVELYSKLLYLTEYTVSLLQKKGMMNESLSESAQSYKELLELLLDCSVKELKNEALNDEEKRELRLIGGTIENIQYKFNSGAAEDNDFSNDFSDMVVTDISTCLNSYLTVGTGYFDEIYVVVPAGGKLYLARGPVYSFYEFTSDKRLTDEEWWALNGITIVRGDYGDYAELGEPSSSRPDQPEWISYFKSDTNSVIISPLEVDWDNLSE